MKAPMARRLAAVMLGLLCAVSVHAQSIKPFDAKSLEQIVAAHRGKPFLLLVWSMDCEFCQASLDVLAKARAADPTLNIVTVTTDPFSDQAMTGQVRTRLASLQLLGDAWGFGNESPERLRYLLDPAWRGEKPRSYWYDATGKRSAYSGMIQPSRLAQWRQLPAPVKGKREK